MNVGPPGLPPYYSQFGEDEALDHIFQFKKNGVCVEVGAHDGINLSNTYHFEQMGWKCILVKPNPELCKQIRRKRENSSLFECAASDLSGTLVLHVAEQDSAFSTVTLDPAVHKRIRAVGGPVRPVEVVAMSLDDILAQTGISKIDFLSIDVEGFEMNVLKGFTLARWAPRVLVIEDNSMLRDSTVTKWVAKQGYAPFNFTGCNLWFARVEDRELVNWRTGLRLQLIRGIERVRLHTSPGLRRLLRPLREITGF